MRSCSGQDAAATMLQIITPNGIPNTKKQRQILNALKGKIDEMQCIRDDYITEKMKGICKGANAMTLYDYISIRQGNEFTVWDKDYDIETYFYKDIIRPTNDWDRAMAKIAHKIEVVDNDYLNVTTNLSEVIENNVKGNPMFSELFIENTTEAIMDDIEAIFSGYVSEQWLTDFANSLI